MAAKDWFPQRLDDMRAWYNNFIQQVPPIADGLKLDAKAAAKAAEDWLKKDENTTTAQTAAEAAVKMLHAQDKPSEDAARAFIKQLKAAPGVTPAMLATLHCVGSPQPITVEQPTLTLRLDAGHVAVGFTKHGHQGILLQCQRGAETDFTLLGLDTHAPYLDNRPNLVPGQPETRLYRAYYADRDQPTGQLSAVASIAVSG